MYRSLECKRFLSVSQLINENTEAADMENAGHPSSETPTATNYFLQYISSRYVSRAQYPASCREIFSLQGAWSSAQRGGSTWSFLRGRLDGRERKALGS